MRESIWASGYLDAWGKITLSEESLRTLNDVQMAPAVSAPTALKKKLGCAWAQELARLETKLKSINDTSKRVLNVITSMAQAREESLNMVAPYAQSGKRPKLNE